MKDKKEKSTTKTALTPCKNCKSENTFIAKQVSINPDMWIQQCSDCKKSYGIAHL